MTSKAFTLSVLVITSIYLIITTYLMNFTLIIDTILGKFPLTYKINLLVALLGGMWTAMAGEPFVILLITAFLTGVNLTLIAQKIKFYSYSTNLLAGGSSIFGIVASGCAACGLPVISLLGLSGSIIYLPLRGMELSYLSIILLFMSLYFLIKKKKVSKACIVKFK